ncbi:rhodanese-like domain protein [Nonlabens ulvanivorans]|uniref:Rhodanese-like domain protein n=1 Tax=Nonlabens ulvanivorans TaxID=906888 RepID=A0A081D8G9_NONUL|nr:rhodanese-like domain-containing protein [Nonlabens ulvanivorans]GAK75215.1 rhodanese-like domain protein [Nonlabens ulvanivorans]
MKKLILFISFLSISTSIQAQEINELLHQYNRMSVPYITVQTLKMEYDQYIILDTRKKPEYEVSHLPGAIWVGEDFDAKKLNTLKHVIGDNPIVVYCSVGIRSEDYGEKALQAGFKNIFNLYGSIFSWKDAGYSLVDSNDMATERVHVFSKEWEKYLKTGEKVY